MKYYKEKTYYTCSDIASLFILYLPKQDKAEYEPFKLSEIAMGFDGSYKIYLNENMETIPTHYLETNNKGSLVKMTYFSLLDDEGYVIKNIRCSKLDWYVCGGSILLNYQK